MPLLKKTSAFKIDFFQTQLNLWLVVTDKDMFTWKSFSQAPGVVEHWGDAVEPESVKAEDVDPHPEVGQKEAQDLPVVVVEQATVPQRVVAASPRVEETGIYIQQTLPTDWKKH